MSKKAETANVLPATDLSTVLTDIDGRPMREASEDGKGAKSDVITLGLVLQAVLTLTIESDLRMSWEERMRLFRLAEEIAEARKAKKSIFLNTKEIDLLCERVNKTQQNMVAGRVIGLLDSNRIRRRDAI